MSHQLKIETRDAKRYLQQAMVLLNATLDRGDLALTHEMLTLDLPLRDGHVGPGAMAFPLVAGALGT